MTEMSYFQINKMGMLLMGEYFSYRLAFVDVGAVICMEQLEKNEEEKNEAEYARYVEFSVYFIQLIEYLNLLCISLWLRNACS